MPMTKKDKDLPMSSPPGKQASCPLTGTGVPPVAAPALVAAGRESVHASRYGTATLPANPSKPFADDGAKYNGTSPANGSASAATCGTTTDWHVGL